MLEILPKPGEGYRIDKDVGHLPEKKRIGTRRQAKERDSRNGKCLKRQVAKRRNGLKVRHGKRLSRELAESGERGDYRLTPAFALYMGLLRYRLIGALWKLYCAWLAISPPTTFTVIPRHWQLTPRQLWSSDPRKLLRSFRTDLYRHGKAAAAGGWLIVYIHGEFDPVAGLFRLHVHGLCSAKMTAVLDRLRTLPRYKTRRFDSDGRRSAIYRPIRIRRKPLYDLPAPLTYIVQAFWPERAIFISDDGQQRRARRKRRIREPYHSLLLLWLDQQRAADLMLLVGVRLSGRGLVPTARATRDS